MVASITTSSALSLDAIAMDPCRSANFAPLSKALRTAESAHMGVQDFGSTFHYVDWPRVPVAELVKGMFNERAK